MNYKITILYIIFLFSNCLFPQSGVDAQFEDHILWVKVNPAHKKSIEQKIAQTNVSLKGVNIQQITPLIQKPLIDIHNRHKAARISQGKKQSGVDLGNYYVIAFPNKLDEVSISKIKASGYFDIVEKAVKPSVLLYQPNDDDADSISSFNAQEYKTVNLYKAWDVEKGDTNVVIGISDLGADYYHIDLQSNIQLNHNDSIDGIDNDLDGFKDNFFGWDFAQNDFDVMSDAGAEAHGTEVSSVCSSVPDNDTMMCGSGFNCRFLPLKIASNGAIFLDAAYNSIIYAAIKGLKVINLSWTEGNSFSQIHQDIITAAVLDYDLAVVSAAGNSHAEIEFYPASYEHVISVAGSTLKTYWENATYSNFVDMSAPAYLQVLNDNNQTKLAAGSSISAPLVAGVLGLVRSKFPNLDATQAMERLRMSGTRLDTVQSYNGYKYFFGRRLDAHNALISDPKSVRMTKFVSKSENGNVLIGGDTSALEMTFTNFLKPTSSSCYVKLSCDAPYIQLLDSIFTLGAMNTYDEITNMQGFSFIIKSNAPKLAKAKFRLEYYDSDGHYDYQFFYVDRININYLDLDTNSITLTIVDNGKMGFADIDATIGSGLKYKNANNSLYEAGLMISTNAGKLSDGVRSIDIYEPKQDFVNTDYIKNIQSSIADEYIVSNFKDTNSNGVGIMATQNSFAWADANHNGYVIIEYQLKNVSGQKINKLNAAVFADWDIPTFGGNDPNAYSKNKMVWDSINRLSIGYNSLSGGLYVGSKILTDNKPIFAALNNKNVNGKFTDSLKIELLSSGVSSTKVGQTGSWGEDISEVIGVTIDSLENGSTATFALAFSVGLDFLEVQSYTSKALEKYKSFRASTKPNPIQETICKNQNYLKNIENGINYRFYRNIPVSKANFIKTDSVINIHSFIKDTTFYMTNVDNVFESDFSKVELKVDNFSANNFNSISVGNGKYLFYTNQTFESIKWVINGDSVSVSNNYLHDFMLNGDFPIKLVLKNSNNCIDSSEVILQVRTAVLSVVNDIFSDEIDIYPIPTKESLFVVIPDNILTNVHATITNLIGVDVGGKYILKNGKNQIDVSNLDVGVYFINIFVSGKVQKFKFIVA